jgi:acyl carrier protein
MTIDRNTVSNRLQEVFKRVFDDPDMRISDDMTAADHSEWDSLMHIGLMASVETEFSISFSAGEIAHLGSVGELIDLIEERSNASGA